MAKFRPPRNEKNYISFEKLDKSYPKMYFLLNLSHCVKICEHLCQIFACLTMPSYQIWSCHLTQVANCKNFAKIFNFLQILQSISEKVTKLLAEKFSTSEVISQPGLKIEIPRKNI